MKNMMVTPLYKRSQWLRWQELFDGIKGSRMTWTFDEWLKNHHEMVQKLKIQGDTVHEVEVDIDEYVAWAKKSGLPINGHTRTDFPIHILTDRMKAAGDFSRE